MPPAGIGIPPYATVVRFLDSNDSWPPPIAWSLVIEKLASVSNEHEWLAEIRYLVDGAPHSEIRPDREFELYEGAKCVALGIVLRD
jgi:hypothetical protein